MCIACQQEAMWFAYLRRKGLITADGLPAEDSPLMVGADEPQPARGETKDEGAAERANKDQFSRE
jgi:hypothetical protein